MGCLVYHFRCIYNILILDNIGNNLTMFILYRIIICLHKRPHLVRQRCKCCRTELHYIVGIVLIGFIDQLKMLTDKLGRNLPCDLIGNRHIAPIDRAGELRQVIIDKMAVGTRFDIIIRDTLFIRIIAIGLIIRRTFRHTVGIDNIIAVNLCHSAVYGFGRLSAGIDTAIGGISGAAFGNGLFRSGNIGFGCFTALGTGNTKQNAVL